MHTQEREFERRNYGKLQVLTTNPGLKFAHWLRPIYTAMTSHFKILVLVLSLSTLFYSCSNQRADLILHNGVIYTIDGNFTVAAAMAVRKGRIIETGTSEQILSRFESDSMIDLGGKAVFPGFIDAHSHFFGYASDLLKCDLSGTYSFESILDSLKEFQAKSKFEWLLGRGWDQNDWVVKAFPDRKLLDSLFPYTPVFLVRIDGHAALCNGEALRRAGIEGTMKVEGGEVICKNGIPTGMLVDNAIELVRSKIPPIPDSLNQEAIVRAQSNCFAVGLTTVTDAGLGKDSIELLRKMQKDGRLKMKIYAMISHTPATMKYFFNRGPITSDKMTVRAIKVYADGALGSRGACLKEPYSDQPDHKGFLLNSTKTLYEIADEAQEHGFQLCTHAIGDSANKLVIDIYASHLNGKNDRRWRIEHCQVVSRKDMKRLGDYSIIPSVQPTHATSDMYWAASRLGKERMKDAYAFGSLLKFSDRIALGTDFPVEKIDPILTFYAAVVRKDLAGNPTAGFMPEEALKRKEAIRGMTIDAAFANFEDNKKGSLEPGKAADFVILDQDIMKVEEAILPKTKTLATYIDGECVFKK